MATDPSFRLELDTATAVRDWLLDASHRDSTEPLVADSLSELAAGIDSQLHGQSEYLEITVSTTTFPPTNSSASFDAQGDVSERGDLADEDTDAAACPADRDSVGDGQMDPSEVYDALPNDAWHSPTGEETAPSERSSTSMTDHEHTPAVAPSRTPAESEDSATFQFVTSYECGVCGAIQEMETSLQVCAFVADCAACGAVDVRFSAVGIPEPM